MGGGLGKDRQRLEVQGKAQGKRATCQLDAYVVVICTIYIAAATENWLTSAGRFFNAFSYAASHTVAF